MTVEHLFQLPEDGLRHELLDGEHVVTPSPNLRHQVLLLRLARRVADSLDTSRAGQVFVAPLDVVFSNFDLTEPDLLYVSNERRQVLTKKNVQGAPDLVVEILSASTAYRDRGAKQQIYERFGVREYWIIDPEADTIDRIVFAQAGVEGSTGFEHYLRIGDELVTELLPGFSLDLSTFFSQEGA
jgi:Uma2 family endonuclease